MKRWFLLVLKLGSALATLGLVALVAYGIAFPWKVADEALPEFRGSHKLLVGFAYESGFVGDHTFESKSHTYIIFPSALRTLATVEVTKDDRGVRTEVQPFGAVEVLAVFFLGAVGVWWFFIRGRLRAPNRNGRA
jgi:hypothetical protein